MKHINNMWRYSISILLVSGICCNISAQNVVFTAQAGADKIGKNNQVQVQYTIKDAQNLQTVTRPSEADFVIVAGPYQQQSSVTNISGNQMVQSQSISLTYVLQPKHTGTFTIPPVIAKDAAGHTYQSNPLTIQVVDGTVQQRRPAQQDPFGGQDDALAYMQQMQQRQQQLMQQMQQRMQQQRKVGCCPLPADPRPAD